jgi:hypothetical protein
MIRVRHRALSRSGIQLMVAKNTRSAGTENAAALPPGFGENIHVTRNGFEFHVSFRTRFGQTKTEKLEAALEMFQQMRIFRPHLNMQKSGIRLVVTRWDGESFQEEPGIENLEHTTPEEVEALIKRSLLGHEESPGLSARGAATPFRSPVCRLELVRKPHESRFQLLLHRQDGTTEEGPLLVRANMEKLAATGLFRADIRVSMTAMNDKLLLESAELREGSKERKPEMLPLNTEEDAKRAETVLNRLLKGAGELAETPKLSQAAVPPSLPERPIKPPEPKEPLALAGLSPAGQPCDRVVGAPSMATKTPIGEVREVVKTVPASPAAEVLAPEPPRVPDWRIERLKEVDSLPAEEINRGIFDQLRIQSESYLSENDHGFPQFTLKLRRKDGTANEAELILAPHYLLATLPSGYIRFGLESRLYLNREDDYVGYAGHTLRGLVRGPVSGVIAFLVADAFADFLKSPHARNYQAQFADLLLPVRSLGREHDLIWPLSWEDQVFERAAVTAKDYGLPVTSDSIVLDPQAPEFIGFRKTASHGMEFREGDEFIRFAPMEIEVKEEETERRFPIDHVLAGWALDGEGRMCVLYRQASGFKPPASVKLVRFLSESEREAEGASLNVLSAERP